jgi:hypothetical protein
MIKTKRTHNSSMSSKMTMKTILTSSSEQPPEAHIIRVNTIAASNTTVLHIMFQVERTLKNNLTLLLTIQGSELLAPIVSDQA